MRFLILTALSLLVQACTANIGVDIHSAPEGALIHPLNSAATYTAPVRLTYTVSNANKDGTGCFLVSGFDATWQSGAQASVPVFHICEGLSFTVQRPVSIAGIEIDYAYAASLSNVTAEPVSDGSRRSEFFAGVLKGFLEGMAEGYASRNAHQPTVIYEDRPTRQPSSAGKTLPVIVPKPITICPDGSYVTGSCRITPSGTYVGD